MFSVIIYALRVDYEFIVEHKEIKARLDRLLVDINLQSKKKTGLLWRLSDDHFWISVSRSGLDA